MILKAGMCFIKNYLSIEVIIRIINTGIVESVSYDF